MSLARYGDVWVICTRPEGVKGVAWVRNYSFSYVGGSGRPNGIPPINAKKKKQRRGML